MQLVGTGGSDLPNLKSEFSDIPHAEVFYPLLELQIQIAQTVSFLYV